MTVPSAPDQLLRGSLVDSYAISLSGLCMVHCLLPLLIPVTLPIAEGFFASEWVHRFLVLLAAPAAFCVIAQSRRSLSSITASVLIGAGFLLLLAGAFMEALENYETRLTVCGAVALAAGHATHLTAQLTHSRAARGCASTERA